MTKDIESNFQFLGNQDDRDEAVAFVDSVLKEQGNFEEFADLSAGLETITNEYIVEVTDDDDGYSVAIKPLNDTEKAFHFIIDRNTRTIYKQVDVDVPVSDVGDDDIDFLDEI